MSEEEQKYFNGLLGFTFDSDDIRYIEKIVDKKDKEIERLNDYIEFYKDLCNKQNEEIERLNNIINTMLEFNLFGEECPLNFGYTEECLEEKAQDVFYEDDYCEKNCNDDYKKCWLKYFKRLQSLKKGDSSNE